MTVDHVALITGGAGGIGSRIADGLHDDGVKVVLAGRSVTRLTDLIADRSGIFAFQLDVTRPYSWDQFREWSESEGLSVDIYLSCAGTISRGRFVESEPTDWQRMWETNVHGTMLGVRAVLPGMLERGWGRVILLSSVAGRRGVVGRAAYSATKGAIEAFGRSLAMECAGTGVTVNSLALGAFRTQLNDSILAPGSEELAETLANIPEQRLGKVVEIQDAIRFLIAASYFQGSTIDLDGGWIAGG